MKENWQLQAQHREEVRRALPIWWVERNGVVIAQGLVHDEAKAMYVAVALEGAAQAAYGRPRNTDTPWHGMFKLAAVGTALGV